METLTSQTILIGGLTLIFGLFMFGLGLWGRQESEVIFPVVSDTPEERKKLVNLLDNMKRYLDQEDIKDICLSLGINYEDLSGDTRRAKARELIATCERRGRLGELIAACERQRSNVPSWVESIWVDRFRPTLTKPTRVIFSFGGMIQIFIGLVFIFSTSPPPVILLGTRFIVGNWDPRQIDFGTAATNGIPAAANQSLQFTNMEISVPWNAPQFSIRAEVMAGNTLIGRSRKPVTLLNGQTLSPLEIMTDYQHDELPDAWLVQPAWKTLTISLVVEKNNRVITRTNYDVRLNSTGDAWFMKPPMAQFATISYSINNGVPLVFDLRELERANGINADPGDTLTIHEVWYHSSDNVKGDATIHAESHLSSGPFDKATEQVSVPVALRGGTHELIEANPFSWQVPEDKNNLVLWLVRNDDTVLDRLYIPLKSQTTAGLIPIEKANSVIDTTPHISLLGVSFEVGNYNPRVLDLRASPLALPVGENSMLGLSDIWVMSEQAEPDLFVWVEMYEDAERSQLVGHTEGIRLTTDHLQLGEVLIDNYGTNEAQDSWRIPAQWEELYIFIVGRREGQEITYYFDVEHILFDTKSTAWLSDPVNANIASFAYEVNGEPAKLMDMRAVETSGIVAASGDTITITDLWYHFSPTHQEEGRINIEASLSRSGSYEGETRKVTPLESLQKGFHPLANIAELSWTIPDGFDRLYLSLTNENEEIVDRLTIPLNAETSAHLVAADTAIRWPFDQANYFDFEDESEMSAISNFPPITEVARSHAEAFSGDYSIAVTTTLSETQFMEWHFPFQADVISLQVYWPENPGFTVQYAQVCFIEEGSNCWSIPTNQGQWNTFTMNLFAPTNGNPENALNGWVHNGLYIQGSVTGVDADHPYTFYVDGIQVSPAQ